MADVAVPGSLTAYLSGKNRAVTADAEKCLYYRGSCAALQVTFLDVRSGVTE
jgi:hypothetical protein